MLGEERLRSGSTRPPVGRRRVTSETCSTHCVLQSLTPSGSPAETSALSLGFGRRWTPGMRVAQGTSNCSWGAGADLVWLYVQVQGNSVVACAKMEQGQTDECKGLRYTYAHCKKGMLDMRTRIRGNRGY